MSPPESVAKRATASATPLAATLLLALTATMLVAVALLIFSAGRAAAATPAFFPGAPTAVQVSREVSLTEAAEAGAVKLGAKGGFTGDDVSLELEGKEFKGPITVSLKVEFTLPKGKTPAELKQLNEVVPFEREQTEAELNRLQNKTSKGDPVKFKLEWKVADPNDPPTPNYQHVTVVDPLKDLAEPDRDFRSETEGLGTPNVGGNEIGAKFTASDMGMPGTMAHEMLHLMGIDDHYVDVYRYKGRDYPLPETGMAPTPLKAYLAAHKPPLPPPPAGRVGSKTMKGYGRCDIMGASASRKCRKISPKDLDWFDSQAGTLVRAQPGETLLNKKDSDQNLGIGFESIVFAGPGETTVANGVSAYCLDHDRGIPFEGLFDVGPKASEMPGYEGVGKLLAYNFSSDAQAALDDAPPAMQAAIWNQTDGTPLVSIGGPEEVQALLNGAGVAENTSKADLPPIPNPNSGSPTTGAVSASGEVLPPTLVAEIEEPAIVRLSAAELYPNRFAAGTKSFGDLVISANGRVDHLDITVQRKVGKRWRKAKKLPTRAFEAGTTTVQVPLGRLAVGKYRLLVSVAGTVGEAESKTVGFSAGRPSTGKPSSGKHAKGKPSKGR
jgi:hypothetical protein